MKILLISNSGWPLYEWCKNEISDFVGNREITFVSAAAIEDPDDYFKRAKKQLKPLKVKHLILDKNAEKQIEDSEVIMVGGGNTYHLLKKLKEQNLLDKIRTKVQNSTFYIGLSAGANIAGPNILTTNDWNVVQLKTFDSLNLVSFNINPHYLSPHDKKIYSGESRDDRINEYLKFNNNPVLGMLEKTLLKVKDDKTEIKGDGIKLFRKNQEPKIFKSGIYNYSLFK